jgi:atypical dual specificity phosphatase
MYTQTDIDHAQIAENLIFGVCPYTDTDIKNLQAKYGITAILSFQTDDDLKYMGTSYSVIWKMIMINRITPYRIPIKDFNKNDLKSKINQCLDQINSIINKGHKLYVHCTAGINRTPTIIAAYLVRFKGMELNDALILIKEMRPIALPYEDVLSEWLKEYPVLTEK